MPPDVKQRALRALWRLLMTLGMFCVGYILWDVQVDAFPALLVPSSWFLYCYMLFFPTSPLAAAFLHGFDRLQDDEIKILIVVFSGFLLLHLYRREPVGMVYIVAFGIVHFCITQLAIYRAAMEPAPLPMCEAPQPDAPGAEAEDSDDTATDTDQEASLAAEPEHSDDTDQSAEPDKPVEPEQMDGADPSHEPPALVVIPYVPSVRKVFEPQPQVSGTKGALWSFLLAILTLGSAVLVAHALIDWSVRDWVLNPAPVDISPLFEAEGFFQANKTELPIPVPHADFVPTGTFGSPCQAAPTPMPVDKSMMWRGIAMATPMPTPMPAPTPAMPEPEPTAVPDEPIDVLKRLFDFDLPDPKPLLKWYFSLPPASQYTVLVICLLVLECLSKPLITLAAHLVVLAIAYLASAAVLALLLIYGFTPERSLAIVLPTDFAFIVSIWWARFWLKNLASTSSSNAAGLPELKNDLESMRARNEQRLDRADSWITLIKDILKGMTKDWADSVVQFTGRLNKHRKLITMLQYHVLTLTMDKARQVDLDETDRIIDELSDKIDGLETSKGDADLLRTVQRNVDGLRRMAENIRTEKADAEELEKVQEELKQMTHRVDELQNTKADAAALEELIGKLGRQATLLADVVDAQKKLTTGVADLGTEMDGVKRDISSLTKISNQHIESIKILEAFEKTYKQRINDQGSDIGREKPKVKTLENENKTLKEENAKLREDIGILQSSVKVLEKKMDNIEDQKLVTQEELQQLRDDVKSDTDQKITQQANELRSEADSQHEVVMRDHKDLEARVGTRIDDSAKAAEAYCRSLLAEDMVLTDKKIDEHKDSVKKDIEGLNEAVSDYFAHTDESIKLVDEQASAALDRLKSIESQQVGSISQADVADEIRLKVDECMEKFVVSDKFRAAVSDAHQLTKKQSQRERLRDQIREAAEEYLHKTEVQEKIYSNIMERQARDTTNPPGDLSEVIPGGRASSLGIGPSNSHAAPDNTNVSSDNTSTTLTIPDELRDDAEDHHGTRGVPLGDGDDSGPRPSGEGNDGTLRLKQRKGKELCEPGSSTGAQLSGPAKPEQAGEEQNSNDGSTSRQPKGLANSMFASASSSGSGVSLGPGSTGGGDGASGGQDQAEQEPKRNPSQGLRRARYFEAKAQKDLRKAMTQIDKEKRQQQEGENLSTQEQETLDSWREKLQKRHASHQRALDRYLKAQSQSKQEQNMPGDEKGPAELSLDLLEKGKNLLDPAKAWQQLAEQQTEQDEETEEKESDDDTDDDDEPDDDDAGPPGVISGVQATIPGGMPSVNTSTPTIPGEPTIPDDVEAHHGARSVPPVDPPEAITGRRPLSPDGTTSAGPSGENERTGPRASSEDDDGTLQPKEQEVDESGESNNPTDAQDSGRQANSEETDERLLGDFIGRMLARPDFPDKKPTRRGKRKPKGKKTQDADLPKEQDDKTEKKEQDEDTDDDDDDAHDGADDDEPHDNDPRGPPPGSGGSHGHNGSGGNDDDDQDGNDGGAPRPPLQAHGLANSRWASPSSPSSGSRHRPESTAGGDCEAQGDDEKDSQHQAEKEPNKKGQKKTGKGSKNNSANQDTRSTKRWFGLAITALEEALVEAEKEEKQRSRGQNQPLELQSQQTPIQEVLSKALKDFMTRQKNMESCLDRLQKELKEQEQAKAQGTEVQRKPGQMAPKLTLPNQIKETEALLTRAEGPRQRALDLQKRANSMIPQLQNKPVEVQPQSLHTEAQRVQMRPGPMQQQTQRTVVYTPQVQQVQYPRAGFQPQQGSDPHMQPQPQQGQESYMRWDRDQGLIPPIQLQTHQGPSSYMQSQPQQGQNPWPEFYPQGHIPPMQFQPHQGPSSYMQSQQHQGQNSHMPRPDLP